MALLQVLEAPAFLAVPGTSSGVLALGIAEALQESRAPYNQAAAPEDSAEDAAAEDGAAEEGAEEKQEGGSAEAAPADAPDPIDSDDVNGGTACEMLPAFGITPRAAWPICVISTSVL